MTDLNDSKMITLKTFLNKLDKDKTSVLVTVKGGGGKITQICTNTKIRDLKHLC